MAVGVGVNFGHGLAVDIPLWAGAVALAWMVNATRSRTDEQRVRGERVLWCVAAIALAVLLAVDV